MGTSVRYFGMLAETLQKNQEEIDFSSLEETNLRNYFNARYPILKEFNYQIAINREIGDMAKDNMTEIALLPPFAGG